MTPRQFLKQYRYDDRLVKGGFYPSKPLPVDSGDRVGVVLFNLGGPRNPAEVEPFLYNLFMDPVIIDIPVPKALRHGICKFVARRRAKTVREEYGLIGGSSPINPLTERQATLLEQSLNSLNGGVSGIEFKVYTAMRYGSPTSEDIIADMERDGISKVVLLPLYPHYSKTTTGASLSYWHALERSGELRSRPTVSVFEYAAHPAYVRAISERIDEGLRRFGADTAPVHLLFSAHGTPLNELMDRRDPYCCLIHSTVDRVLKLRSADQSYSVSFQSKVGPAEWLTPSTPDELERLAAIETRSVLVVPIAFVSDHVETEFELDIEVRHLAEEAGIEHFEVMPGLNDHPLFIEALTDVTLRHLSVAGDLKPDVRDRLFKRKDRRTACHQCINVTEAACWGRSS
ncbi:MAG TPA: ferrochelatase [Rhodothermales bacterium]